MPPRRPAVAASGTGSRCRRLCVLLVAMCVLPAAVHCSSAKGSGPPVPPRHHPFATISPLPQLPQSLAAATTPASLDLSHAANPGGLTRTHRRRSADEDNERRCHDFKVGTPEENSLRSPFFPNPYPNNTDCVRILDAGEGNVIRLEFREMFRVEDSEDCKFDFLEARDGRYGYNDVLNRFCGLRVPSGVMSSGRYMYLHFHSDDTIEYEGFAAVYIVLPRPTQISPSPGPGPELSPCIIHVTGVEGYVNRTDIDRHCPERVNQSYLWHSPLEGMWIINVTLGWKIQMAFLTFKLDKPNDCNHNFVQLFRDNTDIPSMINEFCGAKAETVLSDNNLMHLRYFATPQAINSTFDALFTAYREGNKKPCLEDEFDCQDDTCISRTLRCNGRINCRFLWDEEKEECKKSVSMMKEILSSDHIIIILVIFCLILSGMCFAFLYNCTRKLVRDHRIIREHVRASREARLDAAGKSTPGGSVAALRSAGAASRRPSGSGGGGGGGGVAVPDGGGGAAAAAAAAVAGSKSPRARSAPDDCYVPAAGGLLPMLLRDTPPDTQLPPPPPLNGDAVFLRDGRHRDGSSSSPRLFDDDDDDEDDGMEQDEVDLCDFMAPQPEMRDNECQTRESLFLTASVTTATSTASPTSDQTATPPPPPPPPPSAALLASRAAAAAPGLHPHSQSGSSSNEVGRAPPPLPPGPSPAASTFSTFGHHPHRHRHPGSSASPAHAAPDFATLPLHHQHQHHHQTHQQQHHHHHRHHYPQPPPPPPPAVPPAPTAEQRFRAEAVIEVENGRGRGAAPPPGGDAGRPYSVQSTKSAPDVIVTH